MDFLHILADPAPISAAVDKQLAAAFFARVRALAPAARIVEVDLYADPPPFLDERMYRALWYPLSRPDYQPTPEEEHAVAYAHRQADLFRRARVLALTAPMWNYSVPAILKAWLDQVLCPGLTFRYGEGGAEPLHRVRTVLVFTSSGGAYGPDDPRDCLVRLLRAAFQFVGVRDLRVVWADGQNRLLYADAEKRRTRARARAESLAAEFLRDVSA